MVYQLSTLEKGGYTTMILSLLYHDVVESGSYNSSGFSGGAANTYKLSRPEFESQLQQIEDLPECPKIGLTDGIAALPSCRTLLFTFDDGGASSTAIADILERHGWRGHFFIPTDFIGTHGFLTGQEIRQLRERGHVVGSHSCSHPHLLSRCPQQQLDREWTESVRKLSDILGDQPRVASVPGGFYAPRVAEAAGSAGITIIFNSEPTIRVGHIGNCSVLGRYCVRTGMSAQTAASIARGSLPPRLLQFTVWNSKKAAKRIAGPLYYAARKSLLKGA